MPKPISAATLLAVVEKWVTADENEDLHEKVVTRPPPAAPARPAQSPGLPLNRAVKVLLAEDNRANQLALTRLMTSEGCVVTCALNGEEALAEIKVRRSPGAYNHYRKFGFNSVFAAGKE